MLIGISLGPGDPELLTIKAAKILKRCSKVFVPGELAANLVRPYNSPEILEFPMISDKKELERIWQKNSDIIAASAAYADAGFAAIGDINLFSTFSHLEKVMRFYHPEIKTETIPGVGIVPALCARFGHSLDKSFIVSDGSDIESLIRIKATSPKKLAEELKESGYNEFVLGSHLYTPEERIIRGEMPEKSDYFSVLLARRKK